ncbi:hypothetical protein CY0110_15622 [Crocosphaera chwakensis CCY0110]|uniref:Uncharacterized protein n=1 Tax=Crocosphaera chwakensis CCY0110 TaxID=391612 RepID=A3IHF6_9CHRO|nr:hypothetical protein CY0110_15622 [Crocosphaera chwakensis CCY0110]
MVDQIGKFPWVTFAQSQFMNPKLS